MNNVIVYKLTSGQEVIAKDATPSSDAPTVVLQSPRTLQPAQTREGLQIIMAPFSWGSSAEEVTIDRQHVMCALPADEDLATHYLSQLAGVTMATPRITLTE